MKKVKLVMMLCLVGMISFVMSSCGNKASGSGSAEKTEGDVTEITRKDLNEYIDGIGDQYMVKNTNLSLVTSQLSYDSEVIKDVETEGEEVDTSILGDYPVTYTITVDADAYCKKENKNNKIKGDTTKIVVNATIHVIDVEYAKSMEENGADIIGYND